MDEDDVRGVREGFKGHKTINIAMNILSKILN
jgi:hypothetical protein